MTPSVPAFDIALLHLDAAEHYKALRDECLALFPESFTTDDAEALATPASRYADRLSPAPGDASSPPRTFTLGAFVSGQLVGALTCEPERRLKTQHWAHIVGMMVLPPTQGQGIGRALLTRCLADVPQRLPQVAHLQLSVTASNTGALRLYERHGFTVFARVEDAVREAGQPLTKLLMRRPVHAGLTA